jgi:hypothetical protein
LGLSPEPLPYWGSQRMSSRALTLATVLLLICAFTPGRLLAQENLDAGKSPSQIFAGTCSACHKSPRGLLKTVSPSSLPSFLRQHYTTSPNMAGVLSSYLVSNGATDPRVGEAPKVAKGTKEGTREGTKESARQEARQRPEAEPATQANPDHGADGRNGAAKQRWSKRGKPEEPATTSIEPPKPEPPKPEPPKGETASREEGNKPEPAKPAEEHQPQSAKVEQPAETSAVRPDPVPPVTPAPPSAAEPTNPSAPSAVPTTVATSSAAQASVTPEGTEMAVPLTPSELAPAPPPAAVTASSAPSLPPVPPAGPPAPPISQ